MHKRRKSNIIWKMFAELKKKKTNFKISFKCQLY